MDENGGINFPVEINQRKVGCKITIEALQDKFGLKDADSLSAFKANRNAIEDIIRRKIQENPDASSYLIATN